jgi:hypothetical protein
MIVMWKEIVPAYFKVPLSIENVKLQITLSEDF